MPGYKIISHTSSEQVQSVGHSSHLDRLLLNAGELTVLHVYTIYIILIRHSDDKHAEVALITGYMLQPYITHRWRIVTAAQFLVIIVKIYLQNRLTTLSHLHISDKYILRYSATAWISLYADNAVKILRVHVAILHKDISYPRSNFRTYDHSPMAVLHFTVSNYYVFRWPSVSPAVLVTSALYGYAVVASMEITSLYQHAVAALRVAAVAIRSLVPYFHIAYRQILTEERMNNPEWRTKQRYALYQYILPAYNIYKLRP